MKDALENPPASQREEPLVDLELRHRRLGWWLLLIFLTMGLVLEGLHGLKVGYYLDVPNQPRRLMWTLAHAHGTLLALVHLALAALAGAYRGAKLALLSWASPLLTAASLLLPLGFFLGGIFIHGGDPGLGILLVPLGGALLFAAILLLAVAASVKPVARASHPSPAQKPRPRRAKP